MSGLALDTLRRGWCPSVLRPMQTGDGLLVRVHPRAARLSAAQAHALAGAARACGNGLLDISSRGNIQIRGVRAGTHTRLVELLSAAALSDEAPARVCLISPLAGLDAADLIDAARLAGEIEAALAGLTNREFLPQKFAVAVDGGGLPLDDVEADMRVVALDDNRLAVALGGLGDPVWIGACVLTDGPAVVRSVASAFCRAICEGDSARRIRDLSPEARARVAASVTLAPCSSPPMRLPPRRVGSMPLGKRRLAVGFGLAFGRLDADLLDMLAEWSAHFAMGELRLSPWRSIYLPGVAHEDGPKLYALGKEAGLIVDAEDPRSAITACPGAPACARASVPTHADAARLAAQARHIPTRGMSIHVSGCAKGCARRSPADLTLVGENGRYGVVIGGDARDPWRACMDMQIILDRLRVLNGEEALASPATERLARAFAEVR